MIRAMLAIPVRLLAFVGKELVETVRRPGAVVSLVLGPFLILAVFGLGYSGVRQPLRAVVVAPSSMELPTDPAAYEALAGGLDVIAVTPELAEGEAQLASGRADVVVIAPPDAEARFRAGEQSVITVRIDTVDPVEASYAGFLAEGLAGAVNREIIERFATEGQASAAAAGAEPADLVPPEVIAAPTTAEVDNVAPSAPAVVAFFGPAVLALILQHMAVTLVALSIVRERTTGLIELFRLAPVSPLEVVAGKVLAFGLLGAAVAGITVALLVAGLGVPALGDGLGIAAVLGLLLVASLGVGLVIGMVSDSELQAVQLSLLALLASVFFGGFVLAIDQFNAPVRALAHALPVTHGIRLLQDLMLRGGTGQAWSFVALAVIGLATLVASWTLLRRGMTRV